MPPPNKKKPKKKTTFFAYGQIFFSFFITCYISLYEPYFLSCFSLAFFLKNKSTKKLVNIFISTRRALPRKQRGRNWHLKR